MRQQRTLILGGIILAVLVIAGVAIAVSSNNAAVKGASFDYSSIPTSRTEDGAYVIGNPDAPITVVEFADFLCPHCQEYNEVIDRVIEEHVVTGNAKLEYRFFPTVDRTAFTAKLVECAANDDPQKFWEAHDVMYGLAKRGWNQTSSQEFSKLMNISYGDLLNCANNADQVSIDVALGRQTGVSGTPAIRIRLGDGPAVPISEQHASGGIPYGVIEAAIQSAQ